MRDRGEAAQDRQAALSVFYSKGRKVRNEVDEEHGEGGNRTRQEAWISIGDTS